MSNERIVPSDLYDSRKLGFSQGVSAPAAGRVLYLSGQVAWDENGKTVGVGDLAAQAQQAAENVRRALSAGGASPADVTLLRAYIVNYSPEMAADVAKGIGGLFSDCEPPAQTWIGVASLASPEFLIELEATAVVS
ncbi:MAG: RidA family protein [Myxococcota bacterium]|nr:RidA family protein [Myxococcota bacterium]